MEKTEWPSARLRDERDEARERLATLVVEVERVARLLCLVGDEPVEGSGWASQLRAAIAKATASVREISPTQHCTSDECPFTISHTAMWCGYPQTRRCDCPWDYPNAAS